MERKGRKFCIRKTETKQILIVDDSEINREDSERDSERGLPDFGGG